MSSVEEIKNQKFCNYRQIVGYSTNNCVRFRDFIQKTIKEGRLKFKEKPQSTMTVDVNPFEMNSSFVELVFMSINTMGFDENMEEEKVKEDMELDLFESVDKLIYLKAGEDSLDLLLKQKDVNANVTICRRYSAVFDKNTAKAYREQKDAEVEQEKERIE